MKNVNIQGYQELHSGHTTPPPQYDISDVEIGHEGVNMVANVTGTTGMEAWLAMLRELPRSASSASTGHQYQQDKAASVDLRRSQGCFTSVTRTMSSYRTSSKPLAVDSEEHTDVDNVYQSPHTISDASSKQLNENPNDR